MNSEIWIYIGIFAFLVFAGIVGVFIYRKRSFVPTADKQKQLDNLNRDLLPAGFLYTPRDDCFYTPVDCWQRKTGYCRLYDEGAVAFQMMIDCEPIEFVYGGKQWLIEFWKGQYGITTGAEVGLYATARGEVHSDRFTGTFYENISDSEMLPISFVLKKNGKTLMKRTGIHWWLTGFRLGEFSEPSDLTLDVKIKFRDRGMGLVFADALRAAGYRKNEFAVRGNSVYVHFSEPHTKQPSTQTGAIAAAAQQLNKNNCALFTKATKDYPDTLDQLEYLKAMLPGLYDFLLRSIYSKAFFDTFSWLLEIVYGKREKDENAPPVCCCPENRCSFGNPGPDRYTAEYKEKETFPGINENGDDPPCL